MTPLVLTDNILSDQLASEAHVILYEYYYRAARAVNLQALVY